LGQGVKKRDVSLWFWQEVQALSRFWYMKKPRIGIILDYHSDGDGFQYSKYPWYALRADYSKVITKHGGIPFLLPYESDVIDETLANLDGVVLSGGDFDVPPSFYNQTILSPKVKEANKRSAFELQFVKKALEIDMPILAICHGMQILNVLMGGTLIQDIPEFLPHAISHKQPYPKHEPYHGIKISKGTRLFSVICEDECLVNSSHHQSIDRIGDNLIVSARSSDGVIEAIEYPSKKFVIGVQWHPEYGASEVDNKIIKAFIDSAWESY
jgi:putative glutamine amidotransferase